MESGSTRTEGWRDASVDGRGHVETGGGDEVHAVVGTEAVGLREHIRRAGDIEKFHTVVDDDRNAVLGAEGDRRVRIRVLHDRS